MRAYQVVEHGDPSSLKINKIDDLVQAKGRSWLAYVPRESISRTFLSSPANIRCSRSGLSLPGKDLSGVVLRVGERCAGFSAGDRVLCLC